MCHCEIHNQCVRRRKTVVLSLGFFLDNIVLYLNITPFFGSSSLPGLWVTLWIVCDPQNRIAHPVYKWACKTADWVWHVFRWSPKNRKVLKDEVYIREGCECDGWVCDLESIGVPSGPIDIQCYPHCCSLDENLTDLRLELWGEDCVTEVELVTVRLRQLNSWNHKKVVSFPMSL